MAIAFWYAEANIYRELINPVWKIKSGFARKLITLVEGLPVYLTGIPCVNRYKKSGCTITNNGGIVLTTAPGIVTLFTNKIIELKEDRDNIIENTIIRSAPWEMYKELYHFI